LSSLCKKCKNAGFFSLNTQLVANACKSAAISGGYVRFYDRWVIKDAQVQEFCPEAVLSG
jgi:hypothetical protein